MPDHQLTHADQVVSAYGVTLEKQYWFLADPKLPLWHSVKRRLKFLRLDAYKLGRLGNMAVHDLLGSKMPSGTRGLLGIGFNYSITRPSTTGTTIGTVNRLKNDLRRIYAFRYSPPLDDENYIKNCTSSLNISSDQPRTPSKTP